MNVNELIRDILAGASERTASVSREFTVLRSDMQQPDAGAALKRALEEDSRKNGWKLCGRQ